MREVGVQETTTSLGTATQIWTNVPFLPSHSPIPSPTRLPNDDSFLIPTPGLPTFLSFALLILAMQIQLTAALTFVS